MTDLAGTSPHRCARPVASAPMPAALVHRVELGSFGLLDQPASRSCVCTFDEPRSGSLTTPQGSVQQRAEAGSIHSSVTASNPDTEQDSSAPAHCDVPRWHNKAPGCTVDREKFEALSYKGNDIEFDRHLVDLEFVKFYLVGMDTDRPVVYFMNTETHRSHLYFANAVGLYSHPLWNWPRQGIMKGEIVYHPNVVAPDGSLGVYRFEFEPLDAYPFGAVAYAYEVLAASMPLLEGNFVYYPMPARALPLYHEQRALFDGSRVDVLLEEDVFPDVDFIALNEAEGYGFLRVMSLEGRPDPRDVVIYETLPNELSRVAGIITTVPQTPLSHVNLRAVQDGVPNAFIRGALDNDDVDDLIDSFVHYTVDADGWSLRAATPAEVDAHYAASRPSQPQTPQRDLTVTQIAALSGVGFGDWTAFGVKAANVAVLGTLGLPSGTVPEGFAVPFYFYDEFMTHNGFYDDVAEMMADEEFQSDFDTQAGDLKALRKKIKKGETPRWIIAALEAMHAAYPEGQSLRYRSSTNNEDLPGFSGAGLYDSKTQDPDETAEDGIDKSIKGVWASMWNFRAFTEREFHRIDHTAAAMGVLVHPNYSDELANVEVAVAVDPADHRLVLIWHAGVLHLGAARVPGRDGHNSDEASVGAGSYEVTSLVPDRPQLASPGTGPAMSTSPGQGTRKRGAGFTPSQTSRARSPRTSSLFHAGCLV